MNNAGVAEHHQRQWEQVADKDREETNALLHDVAVIDSKAYARSLYDVGRQSGERRLKCWNNDPDECDCSIHVTLLSVQLQIVQVYNK